MKDKNALREEIYAGRNTLSREWVDTTSAAVAERLVSLVEFIAAPAVFCYLSCRGEVDTTNIIAKCYSAAKTVIVPAYDCAEKTYGASELKQDAELKTGKYGILEPVCPRWLDKELPPTALCLVPGVAFDRSGARVGHGAGIYDRLLRLKELKNCVKIGLAFDFQIFETVPFNEYDVFMDMIITENYVYGKRK